MPCAEKPAIIDCTLPITAMSGQNGTFFPPTNTSSTMPKASRLIATSVNEFAHPFTFVPQM